MKPWLCPEILYMSAMAHFLMTMTEQSHERYSVWEQTSTTSTTTSPARLGNAFLAATCTATEPPILHYMTIMEIKILIKTVKEESHKGLRAEKIFLLFIKDYLKTRTFIG